MSNVRLYPFLCTFAWSRHIICAGRMLIFFWGTLPRSCWPFPNHADSIVQFHSSVSFLTAVNYCGTFHIQHCDWRISVYIVCSGLNGFAICQRHILWLHSRDKTAMLAPKQWKYVAQVLHDNRLKFPKDIRDLNIYENRKRKKDSLVHSHVVVKT